jgi:hypothetical protein
MRRVMVPLVSLFLVGAPACAQEGPPGDWNGIYWWPNPDPLGAMVGTAVTVESGQPLEYEFTSVDKDKAVQYQAGEPVGSPELLGDYSSYWLDPWGNPPKPEIWSCMFWYVTDIGLVNDTHHHEFHGDTLPGAENNFDAWDEWWFDDAGMLTPGEGGSRDDPCLGPLTKTVHITACCGWVEGHVVDQGGNPQYSAVELWFGDQWMIGSWTSPEGFYEFHMLSPGQYVVKATVGQGGQAPATVVKGQGTHVDVTVQMEMPGGGGGGEPPPEGGEPPPEPPPGP